jgi:tRNA pseudouridine32 synthase/23S rRNA pseudouridine746 synthase
LNAPRHTPRDRGFELVHLDDSLLVANKPAGLLAVPGRGPDKQDCLIARVQAEFPDALTVHRLDMATSGLILFARGAEMQSQLSRMFRERLIGKRYFALVAGKIAPETGEIALPLIADWPNRPRQKVDHDIGKPSLTRYRLLDYDAGSDTGYIELEPITGRSHQLRVHLASLGHAIVGDTLYGGREAKRLMLHACMLGFVHPLAGRTLALTSNPPFRSASDAILPPDLF